MFESNFPFNNLPTMARTDLFAAAAIIAGKSPAEAAQIGLDTVECIDSFKELREEQKQHAVKRKEEEERRAIREIKQEISEFAQYQIMVSDLSTVRTKYEEVNSAYTKLHWQKNKTAEERSCFDTLKQERVSLLDDLRKKQTKLETSWRQLFSDMCKKRWINALPELLVHTCPDMGEAV